MVGKVACLAAALVLITSPLASRADPGLAGGGVSRDAATAGPERWDVSGRVRCSVGEPTFGRTCGFRLVRNPHEKATDIWVRNLAEAKASYRLLRYANETFTSPGGGRVGVQRRGAQWQVDVDGIEFYLIPETLIAPQ